MTDAVRPQRVLTVCQGGNVRSVMARYLLNYKYGLDCLACGWEPNSDETKRMLYEWADVILTMQTGIAERLPPEYHHKVAAVLDCGDDVWGLNLQLMAVVDGLIQRALFPQAATAEEA